MFSVVTFLVAPPEFLVAQLVYSFCHDTCLNDQGLDSFLQASFIAASILANHYYRALGWTVIFAAEVMCLSGLIGSIRHAAYFFYHPSGS
jgi:hypothetical protein